MRKLLLVSLAAFCIPMLVFAGPKSDKKTTKKKKGKTEAVTPPADPKKTEYDKLIEGMKRQEGMLCAYTKEGKLLLELGSEAFKHDYLLATRLAETSNTGVGVAGQMQCEPLCFYFSTDSINVYIHQRQLVFAVPEGDPVLPSFHKNFTNPVVAAFKVKSKYQGNLTIDVTDFFTTDQRIISPIHDGIRKSYSFAPDASIIKGVKLFPSNMEVRTQMNLRNNQNGQCITLMLNRSILQLPDTLMEQRFQDNRVGYFHSFRNLFDTQEDKVTTYNFIHRWRLEPKDREAYFRGELVEPIKPIVFYVDTAFPQKWRETIIQGILDWNTAFETAGFKNAVQAKMYPNDPNFDPDDMRYSCVKYATYAIPNAMGPSYVDPRSGEILTADVIWYHNVIQLVHNWRFVQTGAVDKRVRANVFPDDVMCESLRYVISHEIGHTLGLLHNMGASHSYPVEKLRDPAFTQKYGTTPSIMDYARNNYVAQPGDFEKGVRLTPPILGVYDIYAINWGYRLIPGNKTPKEQSKVLAKWIEEKAGDPMYQFGLQQMGIIEDPTAQTEDLGNDPIKAGDYGISNLKIVYKNLEDWMGVKGDTYQDLKDYFASIVGQYSNYLGHTLGYVGGVVYTYNRVGEKDGVRVFVPKSQQSASMKWVVSQLREANNWLIIPEKIIRFGFDLNGADGLIQGGAATLYDARRLQRIYEGGVVDAKNNYTLTSYLDDVYRTIFQSTIAGQALNYTEMKMQAAAIEALATNAGFIQPPMGGLRIGLADSFYSEKWRCCCSAASEEQSATMRMPVIPPLNQKLLQSSSFGQLQKILQLYKANSSVGNQESRDFYRFQIQYIERLMKK